MQKGERFSKATGWGLLSQADGEDGIRKSPVSHGEADTPGTSTPSPHTGRRSPDPVSAINRKLDVKNVVFSLLSIDNGLGFPHNNKEHFCQEFHTRNKCCRKVPWHFGSDGHRKELSAHQILHKKSPQK